MDPTEEPKPPEMTQQYLETSKRSKNDLLSLLSDTILTEILSLLPVTDSARTAILSSRWRRLWTISPLNLDDRYLAGHICHVTAVNGILSRHRGPILRCRLSISPAVRSPFVERWIQTLIKRGVQELALAFFYNRRLYSIPSCLLACRSLRILILKDCRLPDPILSPSSLVNLKELTLRYSILTEDSIADLSSGCCRLESLALEKCAGFKKLVICSMSLRSLLLKLDSKNEADVLIVDAPNLECLMISETGMKVSTMKVVDAAKLKMMGFVSVDVQVLQLGRSHFKHGCLHSLSTLLHSLVTLAISVGFSSPQAKMVLDLLRCFPCLQTLDVLSLHPTFNGNGEYWDVQSPTNCMEHHLKTVKLKGFRGESSETGFARFLVQKACMLQVMTLICPGILKKSWIDTKRRDLCFENKDSFSAQVIFLQDGSDGTQFSAWGSLFG